MAECFGDTCSSLVKQNNHQSAHPGTSPPRGHALRTMATHSPPIALSRENDLSRYDYAACLQDGLVLGLGDSVVLCHRVAMRELACPNSDQ